MPNRDIDHSSTPTDEFQHRGQQHLFNQCPDNIKADAFETNYQWGAFNCKPHTYRCDCILLLVW